MSTETQDGEDDLKERVVNFLRRNFPQIQMHGGSAAIATSTARRQRHVRLGGACSGCGISPMTIQAIKTRMVKEIPRSTRSRRTGMGGDGRDVRRQRRRSPSFPGESRGGDVGGDDDEGPEAPF
ncbi:hypothetical protein C9J85_15555 [Haloferax sp. wsp5]|nr:hypothetical protein C9J85_15555 [Haloferax sp. wsp5]